MTPNLRPRQWSGEGIHVKGERLSNARRTMRGDKLLHFVVAAGVVPDLVHLAVIPAYEVVGSGDEARVLAFKVPVHLVGRDLGSEFPGPPNKFGSAHEAGG